MAFLHSANKDSFLGHILQAPGQVPQRPNQYLDFDLVLKGLKSFYTGRAQWGGDLLKADTREVVLKLGENSDTLFLLRLYLFLG